MHKKQKDCDTLQQDRNNQAAWEKKWEMALHPEKSSAIRVTRAWKPISSSYTLKGHTLNIKVGKMPANKHICHASGIYPENTGKYWEILANKFYNPPHLDW